MSDLLEQVIRETLLTEQPVTMKSFLIQTGTDRAIKLQSRAFDKSMNNVFSSDTDTEEMFLIFVKRKSFPKHRYLVSKLIERSDDLLLTNYINNPKYHLIITNNDIGNERGKTKKGRYHFLIKAVYAGSKKFSLPGGTKSKSGTNIFTGIEFGVVNKQYIEKQKEKQSQKVDKTNVDKSGDGSGVKQTTTAVDDKNFMVGSMPLSSSKPNNEFVLAFQKLLLHVYSDNPGWSKSPDFIAFKNSDTDDGYMPKNGATYNIMTALHAAFGLPNPEKPKLSKALVAAILKANPDKAKTFVLETISKKHKMLSETTIARLSEQGYSVKTESDMIQLKQLIREQLQKSKLQEQVYDPKYDRTTKPKSTSSKKSSSSKKPTTKKTPPVKKKKALTPAGEKIPFLNPTKPLPTLKLVSNIAAHDLTSAGVGMLSISHVKNTNYKTLNKFGKEILGYHQGQRTMAIKRPGYDAENIVIYVTNTGYGEIRDMEKELFKKPDNGATAIMFSWHGPGQYSVGGKIGSTSARAYSVFFYNTWGGHKSIKSTLPEGDDRGVWVSSMSGSGPTLLAAIYNAFSTYPGGARFWDLGTFAYK